jgi:catechol 2,3-dioxygenase-like lactoylglutathione lyase family enzyme
LTITHGQILGGTVTTPDLAAALADYAGTLGLHIVEKGHLSEDLAASWGCPASAGSAIAMLHDQLRLGSI